MRLLQAMAGAEHGGAEAFFERLAPALARAGVTQRLLIRRNPARAEKLRAAGLDVVELAFGGALDIGTRFAFAREIRAFSPQVTLTWMNRATRFCRPGDFVHVGRLGGYYDLKYYRHCRHLIANTKGIRDWILSEGWPAERVHYLPNFVDAPRVPPARRSDFDIPPGAPLILAMGRLHANKAFDVLLDALARLPDSFLWIAGVGPLQAELEAQSRRLGIGSRVRFLGWRDDGPALLAAADVFVCPSRHEPLGNVVIEAWAGAKAVIAAAAHGPVELIEDGRTGLLVPVDDAPALAAALARLHADPALASSLAAAGRLAYEAEFTEGAVVARYLDFFDRVAG